MLWESFSAFAASETENSKDGKDRKRLSEDENKWLNGCDDGGSVWKKKELWTAIHKSTNSETYPFC